MCLPNSSAREPTLSRESGSALRQKHVSLKMVYTVQDKILGVIEFGSGPAGRGTPWWKNHHTSPTDATTCEYLVLHETGPDLDDWHTFEMACPLTNQSVHKKATGEIEFRGKSPHGVPDGWAAPLWHAIAKRLFPRTKRPIMARNNDIEDRKEEVEVEIEEHDVSGTDEDDARKVFSIPSDASEASSVVWSEYTVRSTSSWKERTSWFFRLAGACGSAAQVSRP
ncbi:hypothetical protein EDB86DRAFT_2826428 [Lactarius hatsudake]|nr:hypothetical protein EDB86DRAFT_2826428 [Lactarius hatsudake]